MGSESIAHSRRPNGLLTQRPRGRESSRFCFKRSKKVSKYFGEKPSLSGVLFFLKECNTLLISCTVNSCFKKKKNPLSRPFENDFSLYALFT